MGQFPQSEQKVCFQNSCQGFQRLCALKRGYVLCNAPSTFPRQLNGKCIQTNSSLNFLLNSLNRPISTQRTCGMCWLVPWSYSWGIPEFGVLVSPRKMALPFYSLLACWESSAFSVEPGSSGRKRILCVVCFSMKFTPSYKVILKVVKCLI